MGALSAGFEGFRVGGCFGCWGPLAEPLGWFLGSLLIALNPQVPSSERLGEAVAQ